MDSPKLWVTKLHCFLSRKPHGVSKICKLYHCEHSWINSCGRLSLSQHSPILQGTSTVHWNTLAHNQWFSWMITWIHLHHVICSYNTMSLWYNSVKILPHTCTCQRSIVNISKTHFFFLHEHLCHISKYCMRRSWPSGTLVELGYVTLPVF